MLLAPTVTLERDSTNVSAGLATLHDDKIAGRVALGLRDRMVFTLAGLATNYRFKRAVHVSYPLIVRLQSHLYLVLD